jgi:hypothetical protein
MVEIDLREAKTCRVQTQRPNRQRRRVTPKERRRSERTKGLGQKETQQGILVNTKRRLANPEGAKRIAKTKKPYKNKTTRALNQNHSGDPKRVVTETKVQTSANECPKQLDKPGGSAKC